MAIVALSQINDEFQLVDSDQDIYGWPVEDATGVSLGTVAELMIDTEAERVTSVVLDTRATYLVEDVAIEDGVVRVRAAAAAPAPSMPPVEVNDAPALTGASGIRPYEIENASEEQALDLSDVGQGGTPPARATDCGWGGYVRRRAADANEDQRPVETETPTYGRSATVDEGDLRREEETDAKVGVVKDAKRVAHGDIAGVIRDDVEEMKADIAAVDDKIERALGSDDKE